MLGDIHDTAVDCATWWGIAHGVNRREYRPYRSVTRGQIASFLARLVAEGPRALPEAPGDWFADDHGSVHEHSINALAEIGVVVGVHERMYAPLRSVTRAEAATLVVRSYEYLSGAPLTASRDYFADDDGNPHEAAINKAAEAGFVAGSGWQVFSPLHLLNRGQIASLLTRVLDRAVAAGHVTLPE